MRVWVPGAVNPDPLIHWSNLDSRLEQGKICLADCVQEIQHIGLRVLQELQNGNKMLHLVHLIQRGAPLDQVGPDSAALKDAPSLLVSLGQPQGRLEIQVGQEPLDQLSRLPELLLCLMFARRKHLCAVFCYEQVCRTLASQVGMFSGVWLFCKQQKFNCSASAYRTVSGYQAELGQFFNLDFHLNKYSEALFFLLVFKHDTKPFFKDIKTS